MLIISKRKEQSIKYKKLIEGLNQDAVISNDLSEALKIIQHENVEFIIISDTIKEKLSDFIKKIRILTYNSRPVIIAVSKSNDLEDRLLALENGADDFWGEEISKQEFQVRLKAHLRRYFDSSLNKTTNFLNKSITVRAIQKSLKDLDFASYLLIRIRGINTYRKLHGEIAYEKVLQTLSAIINSTMANNDYIGHITENEFVIITDPMKAEKIASFLDFAFDNILNKFYSTDEYENHFTIQSSDITKEEKEHLMRLNIASIEKTSESDYREVLNNLYELIKLCKNEEASSYIIDRIKLQGKTVQKEKNNKVLIYEPDDALSYLLKNVCEMNNIESLIVEDKNDFEKLYQSFSPKVVLIDWGSKNDSYSLNLAKKIAKDNVKLIFSSSYLNKKEILKSGADLYMPKPYEIDDMLSWIKKFLN